MQWPLASKSPSALVQFMKEHFSMGWKLQLAIKVDNLQVEGPFKSFDAECEVLRNIRHQNLVKIISSCSNNDFKALVLEYVAQGEFGEVVVFCRPLFGYSTVTEHHDRCFMGIGISALRSFNTHCWLWSEAQQRTARRCGCPFKWLWHCKAPRWRRFYDTNPLLQRSYTLHQVVLCSLLHFIFNFLLFVSISIIPSTGFFFLYWILVMNRLWKRRRSIKNGWRLQLWYNV